MNQYLIIFYTCITVHHQVPEILRPLCYTHARSSYQWTIKQSASLGWIKYSFPCRSLSSSTNTARAAPRGSHTSRRGDTTCWCHWPQPPRGRRCAGMLSWLRSSNGPRIAVSKVYAIRDKVQVQKNVLFPPWIHLCNIAFKLIYNEIKILCREATLMFMINEFVDHRTCSSQWRWWWWWWWW